MSSICNQALGSKIKAAMIPNLACTRNPFTHRVVSSVIAAQFATSLTLALDSAYVPGGYTGTSAIPLYAGTRLFFGGTMVEVVSEYTVLTTTGQVVEVAPISAGIAAAATALSYLAAILPTSGFNIAAPPSTATNSTNANGALLTDVNTGYKRAATITGFPDKNDASYWNIIVGLGKELESVHYAVDYDGQYSETGVMQLTYPDQQQGTVAQIQTYQVVGQVQSFAVQAGSIVNSPAQQTAINTLRNLYGFAAAK
jgi:hypothetical protein